MRKHTTQPENTTVIERNGKERYRCNICGCLYKKAEVTCSGCRRRSKQRKEGLLDETNSCPKCGGRLKPGSNFCLGCFTKKYHEENPEHAAYASSCIQNRNGGRKKASSQEGFKNEPGLEKTPHVHQLPKEILIPSEDIEKLKEVVASDTCQHTIGIILSGVSSVFIKAGELLDLEHGELKICIFKACPNCGEILPPPKLKILTKVI